ncbi:hypothetical protein ABID97_001948 [Variovorax sp. OAS795]|uniref:hypothetical protein n=1 Tax=Variovorax sp. OAS795 TaxID=3034231 RepID=UPI00339177F3
MIAPVPAKVTSRIDKEVSRLLLQDVPRYLEPSDPRVVGWLDELANAMPAGRKEAFFTMASVYHLTGDLKTTNAMYERARTHGATEDEIAACSIPAYLNLGYPSKAAAFCKMVVSIQKSNITIGLPSAVSTGAFQFVGELLEQARKAELDLTAVEDIGDIQAMVRAASSSGFGDEQYSQVLDVAGAVMREQRLFWLNESPRYHFDEEMELLAIRYLIDVSPEDAAALTADVSKRIVELGLEAVPLSVAFVGAAESVEA